MLDRMCPQSLHRGSRFLAIKRYDLVTGDLPIPRQSEDVINPARPDQAVVGQIAFPEAGVMQA